MERAVYRLAVMGLTVLLLLAGCAQSAAPAAKPLQEPAKQAQVPATGSSQVAPQATGLSPEEAAWQKVVAEARKEGSINFYSVFAPPEFRSAMSKTMKDQYGINIEWVVGRGAELVERIRVEHRAKQYMADVHLTGFSVALTEVLKAAGALTTFTPPIVSQEPGVWKGRGIDSIIDSREIITWAQGSSFPIIVNVNAVRPEDYPKSYKDLLDPKWKGKIVAADPTIPGAGAYAFGIVKDANGIEYWEKMREQNVTVMRDFSEVGRRVATGEDSVAIGLSPILIIAYLKAGAPVKFLPAAEGAYKSLSPMYPINNAPHPNASKVLMNWLLTKEGQVIVAQTLGYEPIRHDVEYKAPHPEIDNWMRSQPKWVFGDWKTIERWDADVTVGTARKLLGIK